MEILSAIWHRETFEFLIDSILLFNVSWSSSWVHFTFYEKKTTENNSSLTRFKVKWRHLCDSFYARETKKIIKFQHFIWFILFCRAEGSNILLDTDEVCRKARRGKRGKLYEICTDETTHLFREIKRGIELGFAECEAQFRNHKWNCTRLRKSMKKILMIGKREYIILCAACVKADYVVVVASSFYPRDLLWCAFV